MNPGQEDIAALGIKPLQSQSQEIPGFETPITSVKIPTQQDIDAPVKKILEQELIKSLLTNKESFTGVVAHLEPKHFSEAGMGDVFDTIKKHYQTYHNIPNFRELILSYKDASRDKKLLIKETLQQVKDSPVVRPDMMMSLTESFIKNAIFEEGILQGAEALGQNDPTGITKSHKLLEEAVQLTLDNDLGYDVDEVDAIMDDMGLKPGILPHIPSWDKILGTGFQQKTLSVIAAASGVGKSAAMVDFACAFVRQGRDVVIASLEMSQAEFYKRLWSNLLDIEISLIPDMDRTVIRQKLKKLQEKGMGRLVVKEFPTGSLGALGLQGYVEAVQTEKGFDNPVVFVDYLGIMKSDRSTNIDNSFAYYGSIAEELRSFAQKTDLCVITAVQLNRSAINNVEADQSSISESMKIMNISDFMVILAQTPQMKEQGELNVNVVKNRFTGRTWQFKIGFDYKHFRFDDRYNINGENVQSHNLKDPITGQIDNIKDLMNI